MDEPISQAGKQESGTDSREFLYKLETGLSPSRQTVPGGSQHLVPVPARGSEVGATAVFLSNASCLPRARGHAKEEGRCQSPSQKGLQVELSPGRSTVRESEGACAFPSLGPRPCAGETAVRPADPWRVLLLQHSVITPGSAEAAPASSLPIITSRFIPRHLVISLGRSACVSRPGKDCPNERVCLKPNVSLSTTRGVTTPGSKSRAEASRLPGSLHGASPLSST